MTPPTSLRAEAKGFVTVIVLCSGTPAIPIISALSGASIIFLSLKGEGEFTWRTIAVSAQSKEYCKTNIDKYKEVL